MSTEITELEEILQELNTPGKNASLSMKLNKTKILRTQNRNIQPNNRTRTRNNFPTRKTTNSCNTIS